jgi:Eco57I restriction-modification methylase
MTLPGTVGGSLFPSRYLETIDWRGHTPLAAEAIERRRRRLTAWWHHVERQCGPATGLHGIFDLVAMPLTAMLGFRARSVQFERTRVEACLQSPAGTSVVGLVVLPWAAAPSLLWRDVVAVAGRSGTPWGLLIAPPFVSVVEARASAVRRSADFRFPDVLSAERFLPFWALAHVSAFEPPARPIERLLVQAAEFQDRVRNDLQHGVVAALQSLGSALATLGGRSRPTSKFDEALTIVYRLLFLLFVESRQLVPRDHPIYKAAYAVTTLCRTALTGTAAAGGLWESIAAITRLSRIGCRTDDLIVRPFNGRLFARDAAPSLERGRRLTGTTRASAARDLAVGHALVALGTRRGPAGREEITYADLGVEQLGAVYERVLDLDPAAVVAMAPPAAARPVSRTRTHSDRRKQTGTFYTPQALAEFVVRRTLGPLVRGATAEAILALRVVDPAMGSGAFLVAACRYLADAYERALLDEGRLTEADLDREARADIRRRIAEQCLAGIDLNPVAVQLARLSLWLTTLARGKPLNFLDHRLRTGNSLIGMSPDDLWRRPGRPRAPVGTPPLFEAAGLENSLRQIARPLAELTATRDDTVETVHTKSALWSRLTSARSPLEPWRAVCSLWCARWFWPEPPSGPEISAAIDAVLKSDQTLTRERVESMVSAAREISTALGMFHWPLEFADVFYDADGQARARAGFDAVIGNPPWEMLRDEPGASQLARSTSHDARSTPHDARSTSHRAPSTSQLARSTSHDARSTPHDARTTSHDARSTSHPAPSTSHRARSTSHGAPSTSHRARSTSHDARSTSHGARSTSHGARSTSHPAPSTSHRDLVRFIRESGLYPRCDRGHVNLYQPFLERALSLVRPGGRVGFIVPWGFATDDGAAALRTQLVERGAIDTIVGLDNSAALFPIHRGLRFMVIVAQPGGEPRETRARFGVRTANEIDALPDVDDAGEASAYPVRLSPKTIAVVGGATYRIPDVRDTADLTWLERLTRVHPAAGDPRGWGLRFGRDLNATEDRHHFGTTGLPVLEGKHLAPFVADAANPIARLAESRAARLLPDRRFDRPRLAYRDVSGVGNKRPLIAAVLPAGVVTTHTVFCLRTSQPVIQQHFLCGLFNSYVLNAIVRMLMGGHVTTSLVEHLPAPPWRDTPLERRIASLAEALSHPADPPQELLASHTVEAALQASVARLYGLDAATFARVLDGFPLVEAERRAQALKTFQA